MFKFFFLFFLIFFTQNTFSSPNYLVQIDVNYNRNFVTATIKIPDNHHIIYLPDYQYLKSDTTKLKFATPILSKGDSINGNLEYHKEFVIKREISANFLEKDDSVKVFVGFQMCDENGTCFFPEKREFSIFVKSTQNGNSKSDDTTFLTILKFLFFAFLGGIILNIMPCVLPVLSIKAMSLVKQSNSDKKIILKHSFAYAFGVVLSFWILAIFVILLKISGEIIGWGFQFQSPYFVFFLMILIFIFALSMFGLITFNPPHPLIKSAKPAQKSGLIASVFSGIFAVLLATPCTAPLLGSAIGFAFSQSNLIIFLSFTFIGLGLAFPFLLLGFFPKAIQKLPKAGEWMNSFKIVMGFLLFATTLFLYRALYFLIGAENSISVLWFLLLLALFVWIFGKNYTPFTSLKRKFILFIVLLGLSILGGNKLVNLKIPQKNSSTNQSKYDGWKIFDEEKVLNDIKNGKKVFIDFTAEWCLTCQTNKLTVLHTHEIMNLFKQTQVVLYYADNTNKNETIAKWLKKYNRAGVPLYLFFNNEETTIFPEILTKNMIIEKINTIKSNTKWSL